MMALAGVGEGVAKGERVAVGGASDVAVVDLELSDCLVELLYAVVVLEQKGDVDQCDFEAA